jgi:murein DD-endopeptidase MepM/ murein hydrolase activator NlpD
MFFKVVKGLALLVALVWGGARAEAEIFILPTPNKAIFQPGGEEDYFVPTPGKTWTSGTFGCVRTEGFQMHEGLDIKAVHKDKRGEPTDPIYAAASGRVAYLNEKTGLSNYGRYMILQHEIEGLPVFTIYAHLSKFADGLEVGNTVRQGQEIATMGRSTNTRQGISKDRGHLHFEIDLRLNEKYAAWHKEKQGGQRNDHGNWNGKNFVGLDPRLILLEQHKLGDKFSLLTFIRTRPELCRVLVKDTKFGYLKHYAALVKRNAAAEKDGVAGYEVALDFNGVPFQLIPRSAAEMNSSGRVRLLDVNEKEQQAAPCRKLVVQRKGKWDLGNDGEQLLDLLTY